MMLDFQVIKPVIRNLCKTLNDKTILPEKSKELTYTSLENNHISLKYSLNQDKRLDLCISDGRCDSSSYWIFELWMSLGIYRKNTVGSFIPFRSQRHLSRKEDESNYLRMSRPKRFGLFFSVMYYKKKSNQLHTFRIFLQEKLLNLVLQIIELNL